MNAWIIYSKADAVHNKQYIDFYMEEGKKLSIQFSLIYREYLSFGVEQNQWYCLYQGKQVTLPDFAVCRTIYPMLSKQLEYMGVAVFNNFQVAQLCNDKAKTYQYVALSGIKMIDTCFCRNDMLMDFMGQMTAPAVIKSVSGHGGKQVFLLNGSTESCSNGLSYTDTNQKKILEAMEGQDVVIQPLTGNKNQDLRVYVIGKEVIGAVLRTAKDGFKSNYSLGGEVELYQLNQAETIIVDKIIDLFDFGLVGIDFIIGNHGELIFNEIEDVVGARMLYQCSDMNLVRRYLEYISTRMISLLKI